MSTPPKPWRQFEARTTFVRVPGRDWASVKIGAKREFRLHGRDGSQRWDMQVPTVVVGYSSNRRGEYDSALLVLSATWREALGEISPDSLAREGFPSFAHFRRYWMERTHQRFRPLQEVQVFTVRPFEPDDRAALGTVLLERLYREHL